MQCPVRKRPRQALPGPFIRAGNALAARTLSSHAHHPATGPGVRDWALSLIPDLTLASLLKVIEYAQELDNNSSEG